MPRLPRPRRGLPDSRAVVGGLLVAAAMLGTWWVGTEAGRDTPTRYVVAARRIDPGHPLEAADLRLTAMALAPSVRDGAFTDASALVGAVALGPLDEGALLQRGTVGTDGGTPPGRAISFAVETPWAVDGALEPGDRIDVFATSADGEDGKTSRVLAGAVVRHVSSTGGGLGEATGLTITVALASGQSLGPAVTALRASKLTVVRATSVIPAESDASAAPTTTRPTAQASATTSTTAPGRRVRPTRPVAPTTTTPPGAGP